MLPTRHLSSSSLFKASLTVVPLDSRRSLGHRGPTRFDLSVLTCAESMGTLYIRPLHQQPNLLLGQRNLEPSFGCPHTGAAFISGMERGDALAPEVPCHWNISAWIVCLCGLYVRLL